MKQHEIEAEERAAEDCKSTEALTRQISYAMEKINVHERKAGEHEERLKRLEENSSNNVLIFDYIDQRLVEMGAGPANGAPQGDDLDLNVTTLGAGKKLVRFNPKIVDRVERMEAVAQAQSAKLQTTQESLQTVASKLTVQDMAKKLDEVEEAILCQL